MVQDILNDMDSDNVNSIEDTEEAAQVAGIVKNAYYKLIDLRDDWPFLRTLTTLQSADVDNPTRMVFPVAMTKAEWIKYNKKKITYLEPEEFKHVIDTRTELADVVDANGYILNADPTYWTSYDQEYVHFDGYDSEAGDFLDGALSSVYGVVTPAWTHENTFIPNLPSKMFSAFLADAKGTAFLALKQQANAKEENYAKKSFDRFQQTSWRGREAQKKTNEGVNYGRK
jgi:hypothetical protein